MFPSFCKFFIVVRICTYHNFNSIKLWQISKLVSNSMSEHNVVMLGWGVQKLKLEKKTLKHIQYLINYFVIHLNTAISFAIFYCHQIFLAIQISFHFNYYKFQDLFSYSTSKHNLAILERGEEQLMLENNVLKETFCW